MRRGVNRADAIETISAAATAVASLENRVPQASFQKRRWGSCWSLYWCFGSHKNSHRIGHAVLVPETATAGTDVPPGHPSQPPSIVLPFVAPPSSPASFLPSEPPSATQSPTGLLSLTSASANMYSPGGPASIFAIGPYAHETQLVSPPVFSTFTTEPSTAPFTPPPESVHLTTPSSPEVPFARLFEPNLHNGEGAQRYPLSQYEFQSYQLQPGSPVSHLISPCSGISGSGTASPFPDHEFASGHPFFLEFRTGNAPKLLDLDKIILRGWESRQGSGAVTPDAAGAISCDPRLMKRQDSDVASLPDTQNELRNDDTMVGHRVSFEIPAEDVLQVVEKDPVALDKTVAMSAENVEHRGEEKPLQVTDETGDSIGETIIGISERPPTDSENGPHHKKTRTITLGSAKEFKFDNIDGHCDEPVGGSDWWADEKILGEEVTSLNDWSFFPVMQTGVS
ncbi:hypothetical protein F511_07409 [Dorcoceras hygrometricum]|uniref:Hydroxyproline-rich glycoprotein family protein n=1 Tax=Dorcoceras hygrometricum TaxID=472368 RepID=A0A2Z7BHF1_9LAMI|nr:hypothetical protein F511_07409 [Dorcoceras hygrometricum]